jgi:hypothetical protein
VYKLYTLLLKRWTPFFDANHERIDELPIWVRIPGLPPECWSWKCFEKIGNTLGTFMKEDMSFLSSGKMLMARILVSLNIRKGLSDTWSSLMETYCLDNLLTMRVFLSNATDATNMDIGLWNAPFDESQSPLFTEFQTKNILSL